MRDDIYIEATPMTPERGGIWDVYTINFARPIESGFGGSGGVSDSGFLPNPGRDGWDY